MVTQDAPETAILTIAKRVRAELIVVGTHGRTGLVRHAVRSVGRTVIENAPCPCSSSGLHPRAEADRVGQGVVSTLRTQNVIHGNTK
jgi:hypothetical protein